MEEYEELSALGFLPGSDQTKFWALPNPKYLQQFWREAINLCILVLKFWLFDTLCECLISSRMRLSEPQRRVAWALLLTTNRKRLPHVCPVSLFWPWIGSFISELKYLIGWYWLFTLILKVLPVAGGRSTHEAVCFMEELHPGTVSLLQHGHWALGSIMEQKCWRNQQL